MNRDDTTLLLGMGSCTSVGFDARTSASSIRAGIVGVKEQRILGLSGDPLVAANAEYVSDDVSYTERCLQLAVSAAQEALGPLAELKHINAIRYSIVLGLPNTRYGIPENCYQSLEADLREVLKDRGWITGVAHTIYADRTAGLRALAEALSRIRDGDQDLLLVGGVDSYLLPITLERLDYQGKLLSPKNRWGYVPGEGAGFCLLSSAATAAKYNLEAIAELIAVETDSENDPQNSTGVALTGTVRAALGRLPGTERKIELILRDYDGSRRDADEYAFMIARLSDQFVDPSKFVAPADCWGNVGAATGPLLLNLAICYAGMELYGEPLALISTSAEDGERSTALLSVMSRREAP